MPPSDLTADLPTNPPTRDPHPVGSTGDPSAGHTHGPGEAHHPHPAVPPAVPGFELLDEVGRGGMGVVYRARDAALGRDVAVKLLQDRYPVDGPSARRFVGEAHVTAQLQHPGIPPVHQVGQTAAGRPFLAMKLIKGRTLDDLIRASGGRQPPDSSDHRGADAPRSPNLVAAFEKVCEAVGYAHAHGVVHRDLKPSNVMVGSFGEVQVMDWGLAKVLGSGGRAPPESGPDDHTTAPGTEVVSARELDDVTQAGAVLGTAAYMPPEQAIGAVDEIDTRSDVFGLGGILCAVLTGRPPYLGETAEGTRKRAARADLADALARLDGCGADPGLVALCRRCLSVRREDRPADGGEVAKAVAALRAAADDRAKRAELDRAAAAAEAREQRKRRRVQLALAGAVGLLLAAGGGFAWWQDRQAGERRADRERAEAAERERQGRNAEALAALVRACRDALRADDPDRAAALLAEADRRVGDGGGDDLRPRLDRCRADLTALRDLDRLGLTLPQEAKYLKEFPARMAAAFGQWGLDEGTDPGEAARRVADSPIRDRLVAALDMWLVAARPALARAVLTVVDPDPYREAVRDAVAGGNDARVVELVGRPDALAQPPGFTIALGQHDGVPVTRRQELLRAAAVRWPGDAGVLMQHGLTYAKEPGREGEMVRWFQAAVAARPRDPLAHLMLGMALGLRGDSAEGTASIVEALRIDPDHVPGWIWFEANCEGRGDWDGVRAAGQALVRLLPNEAGGHQYLALAAMEVGDLEAAVRHMRDAARLDPDPEYGRHIRATERMRDAMEAVTTGRAAPESPKEAVRIATVCLKPAQRRFAVAVRLFADAFAADRRLAGAHRYNAACAAAWPRPGPNRPRSSGGTSGASSRTGRSAG